MEISFSIFWILKSLHIESISAVMHILIQSDGTLVILKRPPCRQFSHNTKKKHNNQKFSLQPSHRPITFSAYDFLKIIKCYFKTFLQIKQFWQKSSSINPVYQSKLTFNLQIEWKCQKKPNWFLNSHTLKLLVLHI